MILSNPSAGLLSPTMAALLRVLFEAKSAESGRSLARIAGVSSAQTNSLLRRLVSLGLVKQCSKPPSLLFELNRSNWLVQRLQPIFELEGERNSWLAERLMNLSISPIAAVVFGSVARGEDDEKSDLDLFLLWPDCNAASELLWKDLADIRQDFIELFGNELSLMHAKMSELSESIGARSRFARQLIEEGEPIFGGTLIAELAKETQWISKFNSASRRQLTS